MIFHLKNNKGFSWFSDESISVKGYFFDENNCFYENEQAISFLKRINSEKELTQFLKTANGVFTFIIKLKDKTFVASDITRAFPLFYSSKNSELFFSDDISYLKQQLQINDFNTLAEVELLASNHTYGKDTLLKNVYQVQASEYLIIQNNNFIKKGFFTSYAIKQTSNETYTQLKETIFNAFENTFKRLIDSLNGKPVAVPLSGGFDSRLIAVLLKKYNYKNVICYTYGNKNSFEIENSKKTAKVLGFKWFFIEYTDELINDYLQSDSFKKYAHYAGKYSSIPSLQEYFAVKYLTNQKLISSDTVFIPGYAGDLLGGSQFIKTIPSNLKTENITSLILKTKFLNHFTSNKLKPKLKNKLSNLLHNFDNDFQQKQAFSVFEDFDIKEKIAKYIFNSASFYTFFNYQHRFPFWDTELLQTFREIPVAYKEMKVLFDDVLINEYFIPFNVHFSKELQPSKKVIVKQKLKDIIKPFFPNFIQQYFLQKNDWNNYYPITQQMVKAMKKNQIKIKKPVKSYNEIITQWYINFAKEKLK
ncbi:asparagine synthase-related protein [Tenacibaculum sp. M341]|uniref:asparagine synthase-related protein n=1 Tax=Tenacibaculum sp. M341 TaxID=2530339 RepID=UPI001052E6D6|nr:asparagine synthetase B family protein [Tenacibaculum sp. M341]TCI92529.1 asparagine synthetase B family protein [Tenacibaculum sp. M341]